MMSNTNENLLPDRTGQIWASSKLVIVMILDRTDSDLVKEAIRKNPYCELYTNYLGLTHPVLVLFDFNKEYDQSRVNVWVEFPEDIWEESPYLKRIL